MSFRRVCVGVAAVALAVGVVAACGDTTTNSVTVIEVAEGGDAGVVGFPALMKDSGADAEIDAGDAGSQPTDGSADGSICNVPPKGPVSDSCGVIGLCNAVSCGTSPAPVLYSCLDGGHPALPDCHYTVLSSSQYPGVTEGHCCTPTPSSCVRYASGDATACGGGGGATKAYSCIAGDTKPAVNCSEQVFVGTGLSVMCCP